LDLINEVRFYFTINVMLLHIKTNLIKLPTLITVSNNAIQNRVFNIPCFLNDMAVKQTATIV